MMGNCGRSLVLIALSACTSTNDQANVLPESVWDITVNGISHTTLRILFDVANDPDPIDTNDWFCRFQITGTDVRWLEAQFRSGNEEIPKPAYDGTLGWIVAYDRQSDNYIASSGSILRTSDGKWFVLPEGRWDEVEKFVKHKEKENRCWGQ